MKQNRVAVVIPALNEAQAIGSVIADIPAVYSECIGIRGRGTLAPAGPTKLECSFLLGLDRTLTESKWLVHGPLKKRARRTFFFLILSMQIGSGCCQL